MLATLLLSLQIRHHLSIIIAKGIHPPMQSFGENRKRHVCSTRHIGLVLWPFLMLLIGPWATALQSVTHHIDRSYALLVEAQQEHTDTRREQLLHTASKAFAQAYQLAGPRSKVEALLGASQTYLLMRHPPKVFPFLWSASPLQRAEKSLQQALVLDTKNGAAALLMGLVLWRQADTMPDRRDTLKQRSRTYLWQAREAGFPVQIPGQTMSSLSASPPLFAIHHGLRTLRYADTRGTGSPLDLLFCYHTPQHPTHIYGVVVIQQQAYPLSSASATRQVPPAEDVEACTVAPRSHEPPLVVAIVRHNTQRIHRMFRWDGRQFMFVGEERRDAE